jgi:integrase
MAIWKRYKGRRLAPGDPEWEVGTWVIEFSLRGHYVKEALPEARTKQQAEQAETNMRQAIYDRRFNRASGTTLLSDFIDKVFLPYAKDNKRSHRDDEQRAGVVKQFFKGRAVRDITPMLIEKFKSDLRKRRTKFKREMNPATVNRHLQVLSKVLSMAYENGLIDCNPMSRVKRLRESPPRERWLSGDEEDRLLPELEADGAHMVAFATLPLNVGFRAGELLSRRYGHVDFDERFVEIDETKTGRPRRVPLNSRALATLKELRQGASDDELIFDPRRTGRRRRQMLYRFAAAIQRAKIEDFHYHDLRHTFATKLRAEGIHEYDIADLLGHSTTPNATRNTKVTRGYAHGIPSRLREAVEKICNSNVVEFRRKAAEG